MATRQLIAPKGKPLILAPVHPNEGLTALYQRQIDQLIEEMNASVLYWLTAAYRRNEPEIMAADAPLDLGAAADPIGRSPAYVLNTVMRRLARRWQRRFNKSAPEMAEYFATAAAQRTDGALKAILKRSGFAIEFKMSPAVNDIMQASVAENVQLIKSIPQQYLTQVQGHVMRAVQVGRDVGGLREEIEKQFGVTKRRAALISRDQNSKATATITRARQTELGITEAIWSHSRGGKEPRPEHVAFSGKRYNIAKGAYLEGKWTWPGVEINCRCVGNSVIPGFN